MNAKYVVSSQGPIDRMQPGMDVTGVYAESVLARLILEGYIEEVQPPKRKAKAKAAEDDEVTDGTN